MARGDIKRFTAYEFNKGLGAFNNSTNVFKWVMITEQYSAVDENAVSANLAGFTQVATAGAYTANQTIASTTWVQTGGVVALDGADTSFAANASNPITGKSILVYNDTATSKDTVAIIDLTSDGSTAADTTQGLTLTFNASGIVGVTVNA